MTEEAKRRKRIVAQEIRKTKPGECLKVSPTESGVFHYIKVLILK